MEQNIQRTARYNGISFVDIDGEIDLPPDFETDRIPNKGDVMCFRHYIGNDSTFYYWEVLYVYDVRTCLTRHKIEDCEHFSISIYIIMKRIHPELGDKPWKSINEIINKK